MLIQDEAITLEYLDIDELSLSRKPSAPVEQETGMEPW